MDIKYEEATFLSGLLSTPRIWRLLETRTLSLLATIITFIFKRWVHAPGYRFQQWNLNLHGGVKRLERYLLLEW
jgi:hypothetical protein